LTQIFAELSVLIRVYQCSSVALFFFTQKGTLL
jgi:hypothetical protein